MPSEPRQAQALVQAKERNQPLQFVYSQHSVRDPARQSGEACTPRTARMLAHRPAHVNALARPSSGGFLAMGTATYFDGEGCATAEMCGRKGSPRGARNG